MSVIDFIHHYITFSLHYLPLVVLIGMSVFFFYYVVHYSSNVFQNDMSHMFNLFHHVIFLYCYHKVQEEGES